MILLTLAATSVIGTVIPQNQSLSAYFHQYGEFLYRIFYALDIFDMYHSWWFQFLLLMLMLNIIVCSADRLSATWKIIFVRHPSFKLSRFRKLPDKAVFEVNAEPEALGTLYEPVIAKSYRYVRKEQIENGYALFAEKGRWTRIGVYIVHLSVIFLVIGGLIGSIFGFEGFVNIPEGDARNVIHLRNSEKTHTLPFDIRCEDFNVSFYENGAPKEYRSTLIILEKGNPVLQKDIIVNDPLRYRGINIFQSSYGMLPPSEVMLNFTSHGSGLSYPRKVPVGEPFDLPEGMGQFVIQDFRNAYNFMGHNLGEAFIGKLIREKEEPAEIPLPLRYPNFDKMRKGDFFVSVTDYHQGYYTGLQVTRDPGVLIVYTGFVIMIAGIFITFFMCHETLCVEMEKRDKKSRITVTGIANKNKLGMISKTEKLAQRLKELSADRHKDSG